MSEDGNGLDQPQLASALRNYLPSSLQRQCLTGQEIRAPQACVGHLNALLHTVSTYLPRQVVTPFDEFAAMEGTHSPCATLCNGDKAYMRFVLQKQ